MPELPEVETIARDLDRAISGRRIAGAKLFWPKTFDVRGPSLRSLRGDRITRVHRIGKFVVMDLESGRHIAVHLRMTGQLIALANGSGRKAATDGAPRAPSDAKHTRLLLRFEDGGTLAFSDTRKFGRWRIVEGDVREALGIGVDPFDPALTPERLYELTRGRTTPIKTWLLDQRHLSGIGNIYASEALYDARIRPTRRAGRLSRAQSAALLHSLRKVMRKAISYRGSSVDDYVDGAGMPGEFQKKLAVYGRGGMPCRRCKTVIRRVVLAQRGTFFCPVCQL